MKELIEKYKYHIGGSTIGLILLYLIYNEFIKKSENSNKEPIITFKSEEKEIVKAEISHEEFILFMKTLKNELQNLTQSMMQFNANHIKTHSKYKDFRDKLFTKDIVKKSILIDSKSVNANPTNNYVVKFGEDNYSEVFKNVIGFRLVKATVPHSLYNVDNTNNQLDVSYNGGGAVTINITPGRHIFQEIANVLKLELRTINASFNVTPTNNTFKYTISATDNFTIDFINDSNELLGFTAKNISGNSIYISDKHPDQTKHFIDLVIPEIPDIACKMGSKKQMIDRIPLNSETGSLVYYRSPEAELQTHNYFYPMKLSSLNIQLYENDSNTPYNSDGHNYFEFEITIVKNTELFK